MGDARPVTIVGKPLQCVVCGHDHFAERKAQLNTRLATFFDFDWVNPQAECYICSRCGYVHWFLR